MDLQDYRKQLDEIDGELLTLFQRRMEVVAQIATHKKIHCLPILDVERENKKIHEMFRLLPPILAPYGLLAYETLLQVSREYQRQLQFSPSAATGEKQQ